MSAEAVRSGEKIVIPPSELIPVLNARDGIPNVYKTDLWMRCPLFVLAAGPFDTPINIEQTDERITRSDRVALRIQEFWRQQEFEFGQKYPGRDYVDNEKVLVREVWADESGLHIKTGQTWYSERIGTQHPRVAIKDGMKSVATTGGVVAVLETLDGHLVYAILKVTDQLFKDQIDGPHVMGGILEPINGVVNPELYLVNEISEETGVGLGDIEIVSCLGVILQRMSVDICYYARVNRTSRQVLDLQGDGEVDVFVVRNDPVSLADMILDKVQYATGGAFGSTLFYGSQRFGEEWAKELLEEAGRLLLLADLFGYPNHYEQMKEMHRQGRAK